MWESLIRKEIRGQRSEKGENLKKVIRFLNGEKGKNLCRKNVAYDCA